MTDPGNSVFYRSFTPDIEIRSGGDGRTIVGYAVPFDRAQQIDDRLVESFDRNAFNHQMNAMHRVPYYHGHRSQGGVHVGSIVLARADPAGLYTESRVAKTQAGDDLLALIANGSMPDQSVGFRVGPAGTQMRSGVAHRVKADLTELAAVPNGAYGEGAAISGVRAFAEGGPCPTCGHGGTFASRADQARQLLATMPTLPA